MHTPTRRQREVLDMITRHLESKGFRPSYALIARQLGLRSKAGIARIVKDLESRGLLERCHDNGSFSIKLPTQRDPVDDSGRIDWLEIPPSEDDDLEAWQFSSFPLPDFMLGGRDPDDFCAMRVTEDVLENDGISSDDIVLVEVREFARDGDIIAALIEKKRAVLRKYYREGTNVLLCGSDADGDVITVSANKVKVLGVYRGLLRPIA